jgi:hypothetical protein
MIYGTRGGDISRIVDSEIHINIDETSPSRHL